MGRPRKGQPPPGQQTHGTEGGYQMHMQRRTPFCEACRAARRFARRAAREKRQQRGRCAPGLGWPLLPGKEA